MKWWKPHLKEALWWGVISKSGRLHFVYMEGSITAETYIDRLEYDFIWMHDNAPPHVVLQMKGYLERKGFILLE